MIGIFLLSFVEHFNVSDLQGRDFYQILGIQESATTKDISKVYKRHLVQKKREKDPSEITLKTWKQFEFAHAVISNPSSRELYNKFGNAFLNATDFSVIGYQSDYEIEAIKRMQKNQFYEPPKFGGIITYPVQFDMIDFMEGGYKTIRMIRTIACECPRGGRRCPKCRKEPFEQKIFTHKLQLPMGALDMHRLYFKDIMDEKMDRGAGDIVFIAYLKPGDFTRDGADLYTNVTIPLADAISGDNVTVTNVDGSEHSINIKGIQHGGQHVIKGQGLPYFDDPKRRGDLYVKFLLEFPKELTAEQAKIIDRILPDDPSEYL